MGSAGRRLHVPYLQPRVPPAGEAVIAPGGAIRASWDLRGGHGAEIEIKNTGSAPCEFAGHLLRAGKTAMVSVRDGTRDFALEIDSARGTQVRLAVAAWRPAPSPRRTLGTRKVILRDPKTQVITSIVEEPVWVVHEEPR
jgi:hypothetical protein